MDHALPISFVVFAWWSSTGIVMLLDTLPRHTHRWSVLGGALLVGAALYGLWVTSGRTGVADAYVAFACALTVWGWQELAFLTGIVTGPRKSTCGPGCGGWKHFVHGCAAILYHEILIAAVAAAVFALTWGAPNPVGSWTFLVLWTMRQSAKLNLHLGVRNLGLEFLPPHLKHLACYFRRRSMNALMPFSIVIPSVIAFNVAQAAGYPMATAFDRTALALAGTLLVLAILEHVLLVVPVPASLLWGRRSEPLVEETTVSDGVVVKPL